MTPYDEMPAIKMTSAELRGLDDRSSFIGEDRVPGQRFRCNLNYIAGKPRWVVGTFYVDEAARAKTLRSREAYRQDPWSSVGAEDLLFPDRSFTKILWERVEGTAPEHTTEELQGLVRRHDTAKVSLSVPAVSLLAGLLERVKLQLLDF